MQIKYMTHSYLFAKVICTTNGVIPVSPTSSSQCLTLGSRKIDCKQTHYTTFSIKKLDPSVKHWDDTIYCKAYLTFSL
ncbi:MAG: hypothetical protein ACR5LA_11275 [Wolbachia sp.]